MARRKGRDRTPEEVVTELHPYHEWSGPHTLAAIGEMAELVRYLNHATQNPEALPDPGTVGETLRLLGQTVRRLPQVMKQAGRRLEALGGEAPAGAELGERLDALGQEIERAGFTVQRLSPGPAPGSDW